MIRGTCSCGAVTFQLEPPTDFVAHCHCTSCQRASAAAFLTWTSVPLERFHLDEPAPITWYRSSDTIRWGFCSRCGTSMLYRADTEGDPDAPQTHRMHVAAVDPRRRSSGGFRERWRIEALPPTRRFGPRLVLGDPPLKRHNPTVHVISCPLESLYETVVWIVAIPSGSTG